MTRDFFETVRCDYSIDQKLGKWMASRVKMAFNLANVQQSILEGLGYKNLAPLFGNNEKIWFYIKDNKFHTIVDGNLKSTNRYWKDLDGDILLCLNDEGYHFCEPSNEDISKLYKVKDGEYYFLWADDEYSELNFMRSDEYCNDEFEFIKEENYVAIRYHKKKEYGDSFMSEEERLSEQPRKDVIISRSNDICHIGVFTYFYKNKIIVEHDDTVIVYDTDFNILYENDNNFKIWEIEGMSYLIFPYDKIVFSLSDRREIELKNNEKYGWDFVKTYKNIFICYNEKHFPVQHGDYFEEDDWWYELKTPVRNTFGHVFDSSFTLLREFNVMGEIGGVKEIGDVLAIKVKSSSVKDYDTDSFYNVKAPNVTRHIEKTDEDFSIPDISFRKMIGYEDLFIVKTKVPSLDIIDFSQGPNSQFMVEKCGVYRELKLNDGKFEKVIDCQYDQILSLHLTSDDNIYYAGIIRKDDDYSYDLYINHEIVLQKMPFVKGQSLKQSAKKNFIIFSNCEGKFGIIRQGKIIFEPKYDNVRICVHRTLNYSQIGNELEYLFIVSDGKANGICSARGKLILPLNYSMIDIDEDLCIILKNISDGSYEVGWYDKEKDIICHQNAEMKDGAIQLDDDGDYVWDGSFRFLKEKEYSEWNDQELRDAADIAYEGHSRLELGLED